MLTRTRLRLLCLSFSRASVKTKFVPALLLPVCTSLLRSDRRASALAKPAALLFFVLLVGGSGVETKTLLAWHVERQLEVYV